MLRESMELERHFGVNLNPTRLRVYLAGASRELDRVTRMALALEAAGTVEITHKWWSAVMKHGVGTDAGLERSEQAKYAREDLDAVRRANCAWILWPEAPSSGALIEFGFALAKKIPCVVTGWKAHECIFTAPDDVYRERGDMLGLYEVLRRARDHVDAHDSLAFVT